MQAFRKRVWKRGRGLQVPSPPPLQPTTPCNPPPPPGDRQFHVFLVNIYCVGLCCLSALHMAVHCFPITSNQSPVCVL